MPTRFPEPEPTVDGPAYEGRRLARPGEEVVDQGVGFDVRTLISRRGALGLMGLGIGATALAACGSVDSSGSSTTANTTQSGSTSSGEIPQETAGPYPGDGSNGPDVLEESGIVRSDIRTSIGADEPVDGVPLSFTFTVTDMANDDVPFENVAVYAWHCDAQGRYSMYSEGVEGETWLRGVQVADAKGQVRYTSIVPACYDGRWPHIHFEVYPDLDSISDSANAIATSQMALPEDVVTTVYAESAYAGSAENLSRVSLESDGVFGDDDAASQLPTITGSVGDGYVASLPVRVDTATEATSGGAGPSGGDAPS